MGGVARGALKIGEERAGRHQTELLGGFANLAQLALGALVGAGELARKRARMLRRSSAAAAARPRFRPRALRHCPRPACRPAGGTARSAHRRSRSVLIWPYAAVMPLRRLSTCSASERTPRIEARRPPHLRRRPSDAGGRLCGGGPLDGDDGSSRMNGSRAAAATRARRRALRGRRPARRWRRPASGRSRRARAAPRRRCCGTARAHPRWRERDRRSPAGERPARPLSGYAPGAGGGEPSRRRGRRVQARSAPDRAGRSVRAPRRGSICRGPAPCGDSAPIRRPRAPHHAQEVARGAGERRWRSACV